MIGTGRGARGRRGCPLRRLLLGLRSTPVGLSTVTASGSSTEDQDNHGPFGDLSERLALEARLLQGPRRHPGASGGRCLQPAGPTRRGGTARRGSPGTSFAHTPTPTPAERDRDAPSHPNVLPRSARARPGSAPHTRPRRAVRGGSGLGGTRAPPEARFLKIYQCRPSSCDTTEQLRN